MQRSTPPAIGFPWRFIVYSALALYLVGDLHFCHGPLRRHIEARRDPPPEAVGPNRWVASVNAKPILSQELDRAVNIYLWKRGKSAEELSDQNRKLIRLAVREELIARRLISTYAQLNPVPFDSRAAEAEYDIFRSRLDSSEDDFQTRLELQDTTEGKLRQQFQDEEHETAWIDAKTATARTVDDAKVRAWFDANRKTLAMPERIRAAHIFRVTQGLTPDDAVAAGEILRALKLRIEAGEIDFAQAAAEISEDERAKKSGGDLGYFSKERLPPKFWEGILGQKVGILGEPFRSEIGWHLVRVDERLPARAAEFEDVESEIRAFLESEERRALVTALVKERRGFARFQLFPIDEPAP